MRRFIWLLALVGVLASPMMALAQGLLVNEDISRRIRLPRPMPTPTPPASSYRIKELDTHVRLQDQVAKVQVSQSFVNTGSQQMEVSFVFPLPHDGAIDQLTFLVDGKEFPGKLMKATDARRIYEETVRRNRDPALLEWLGTGMFQTSVFPVPPGAERKVTLTYSQLCRRERGLTDFLFPLSTAKYTSQPVEKLNVQVNITSGTEIKNVYSPTHSVSVDRSGGNAAIKYKAENTIPGQDFRLFYDVGSDVLGTSVVSYRADEKEDGYFLLLATPDVKADTAEIPAKTVVFVVDRSGSMSGQKIEQAKGALKFVLNNLREGDLFNIVAYDTGVESFRPELEKYNDETRKAALGFVEGIYAGGSTNISGALETALGQLKDTSRPSYVVFLTDGLPTVGETNEMKIVEMAKKTNQVRARVLAFGVGYDVNSRMLDRLVRENFGQSEYVLPEEDIEARVASLYNRIKSPVMTDVKVSVDIDGLKTEEGEPVNRVYPREVYDLFAGEQIILVGRYKKSGAAKVTIRGKVHGSERSFDFPAELVAKSNDDSFGFVEKLWAMRRIGEIIDEVDLKGHNEELVQELVALATRHGVLTPYTSFLADENTNVRDLAAVRVEAEARLKFLEDADGASGVTQRAAKAGLQRAGGRSGADSYGRGASTPSSAPAGGGGGGFGGGGFGGRQRGPAVAGAPADRVEEATRETVRNVAQKTFYRRADRWIDSVVTEELEKKARKVVQFSDEYFALADRHGKALSQYLVFDEPVLIALDGETLLIEPSEN
jgi:Ca-activated chloride channel family protein